MEGLSGLKLRRIPALLLFFVLGPALLLTVFGVVCYRRSSISRSEEELLLTEQFHLHTELTGAEYVRPGTKAYFGIRVNGSASGTPFLFCPEILVRPLKGNAVPPPLFPSFLEKLRGSEIEKAASAPDRQEWLIPDLYLLLPDWRNLESFFYAGSNRFPKGGISFRIGRVHLIYSDPLFNQITADYRRPRHRFGSDIIAELSEIGRAGITGNQRTDVSVADEISRYISNPDEAVLEEVTGIWLRNGSDSFTAFDFRFPGITAVDPASFILFQQNKSDSASSGNPAAETPIYPAWQLRCPETPIPVWLLSKFAPGLGNWGNSCWLTGEIESYPKQDETGNSRIHRQTDLTNLTFRNASLSDLLANITSTRIEGMINRLTIRNGNLSDTVFLGEGRLDLGQVQLKKDFLVRFQKEFQLEFQPSKTLVDLFPDNMVPFDRIVFDFVLQENGILLKPSSPKLNGIAGICESTERHYQFALPADPAAPVSYPRLLATLADSGETRFWSPFYRDALNHLPVTPQTDQTGISPK